RKSYYLRSHERISGRGAAPHAQEPGRRGHDYRSAERAQSERVGAGAHVAGRPADDARLPATVRGGVSGLAWSLPSSVRLARSPDRVISCTSMVARLRWIAGSFRAIAPRHAT